MNITNTKENTIIWFITVEVQVNGMIEITRLNECNGSNKYGSCVSCGKFSMKNNSKIILVREPFLLDDELRERAIKWVAWANKVDESEYNPFARGGDQE